jgi:predicted nucleic acid-binding protein
MAVPVRVPRVIANDPDDDHVLACALAAGNADLIVSGDKRLLGLGGEHQGVPIVTPAEAVSRIAA